MKVLLLGGSKFMGLELIKRLIDSEFELYIINRGNSYWNGKFYEIIDGKNCKHIKLDRNDHKFGHNIKEMELFYDYIIDFTCFERSDVDNLFDGLELNFKNYIFISTDSVYNACDIGINRNDEIFFNNTHIPLVVEEDTICTDRVKGKKRDSYGYNKFKCEDRILEKLKGKDISYYILRLPDVIGEFDETYRIWYYVEWLRHINVLKIEFEKIDEFRKLSFVYSSDVCSIIVSILEGNKKPGVYNISHTETLTLVELIEYMAKKLNVEFQFKVKDSAITYYPSVNIGAISNEKAKYILDFKPTSLFQAIDNSIMFFEVAHEIYPKEYIEMIKDLPKKLRNYLDSK
jgi:nucleoside-diphosphate-sugar epimerase